jgi:glycosyltransferase involved in cell wall biosynthesis
VTDRTSALGGLPVVYFGNDWGAENRTSSHHIARRLAMRTRVLYVDSPGLRAPQASARDLSKLRRKLAQALRPAARVDGELWRCTGPQLPWRRWPAVGWLNRRFAAWAVRRAMREAGITRCVLWFAVPHPGFLAGRLGESLVVYYCIDDYAAHPGVDTAAIEAADEALTRSADRVFVAPPALVAAKRALNPTAVYSPHGVDVELFRRAEREDTPVPETARALPGPVVGYFGSIADWIDVELVAHAARSRPDWSFLMVGHVSTDVGPLRGLPNVHLVGPQPYEALAGWAKAFDVAIIPYRMNRQVLNANPLKLREYLATGRPIVAVPNPEILKFAEHVRLAQDAGSFVSALDAAIAERDPVARSARIAAVADTTWEARVDQVLETLTRDLALRRPEPSPR